MATVAASPTYTTAGAPRYGIMDWLTTVDHKKIGILYIVNSFLFFFAAAPAKNKSTMRSAVCRFRRQFGIKRCVIK